MIIISVTVIFDCLLDIRISQVQIISSYSVLPVLKVILNLNQEKKVPRHGCVLQSTAVFGRILLILLHKMSAVWISKSGGSERLL